MKDQSASKLRALRDPVLKLLVNGVPSDVIILNMVREITNQLKNNEKIKWEIIHWASFYDTRAQNGSKTIFHLEAMFARFMLILAENKI